MPLSPTMHLTVNYYLREYCCDIIFKGLALYFLGIPPSKLMYFLQTCVFLGIHLYLLELTGVGLVVGTCIRLFSWNLTLTPRQILPFFRWNGKYFSHFSSTRFVKPASPTTRTAYNIFAATLAFCACALYRNSRKVVVPLSALYLCIGIIQLGLTISVDIPLKGLIFVP